MVNFAAPAATSECSTSGTPVCTPASGSFFPIGTTTVNCMVTNDQSYIGTCSFTVTVNGTVAPVITCPPNVTASTVNPGDSSVIVTFPTPQATSSCSTGPIPKKPDRNVDALANACTKVGTATIVFSGVTNTLNDPNMSKDHVLCGGS